MAAEAIRQFVENNEWQIHEINAAVTEADAGDFASDGDVRALARKWQLNARSDQMPQLADRRLSHGPSVRDGNLQGAKQPWLAAGS